MSRVVYVNGRYLAHAAAVIHVEDRGYQFADGVYEVISVYDGRLVDAKAHYDRLDRSLSELEIAPPMSRLALGHVLREVLRRNRLFRGIIYIQMTRGVAKRDHAFPHETCTSVVVTARRGGQPRPDALETGVEIVLVPETRWARCDIKSVSLLPNVLAKQHAKSLGAFEAWFVEANGAVTEGSSTNAWIVDGDGNLVTRNLHTGILSGVTRNAVVDLAAREGVKIIERAFTADEARAAPEAFLTSTTSFVMPVVRIDGDPVANGRPGVLTRKLQALYDGHFRGVGRNAI
jgi:D-alanine transaminase